MTNNNKFKQPFFQLMTKNFKNLGTGFCLMLLLTAFTACKDNMQTISVTRNNFVQHTLYEVIREFMPLIILLYLDVQ